ncbi:YigZ family protein [Streptococcus dentapri]|uniref:YigZ family protein n=1 Tax=Streptococcus dentapri TaxID=573564 RepID=A0ABV8D0R8_9STRE
MAYKTITQDKIIEETIKKSRFLCHMKRVSSEQEARDYIAQIKKEHHKANHSCSAMIIGDKSEIKRSSDDGEPSGTAGIPMLTVLEKQELTNLVAVVTRYFGGIKLGTGGLIRAYSGCVAHAIADIGIVEVKRQDGIQVELTYSQYQSFPNFLTSQRLQEAETEFSDRVLSTIFVDPEKSTACIEDLNEFYNGKVTTKKAGNQIVEVPMNN